MSICPTPQTDLLRHFGQAKVVNCSRNVVKFSSHSVVCTIVSVRVLTPKESLATSRLICASSDNSNIRSIDSSARLKVNSLKLVAEFEPLLSIASVECYLP